MNLDERFELFDWVVEQEEAGERIDKFLSQVQEGDWSRTQLQGWIKDGNIQVNGKGVKGNYRLQEGDEITLKVPPPVELDLQPEPLELNIV